MAHHVLPPDGMKRKGRVAKRGSQATKPKAIHRSAIPRQWRPTEPPSAPSAPVANSTTALAERLARGITNFAGSTAAFFIAGLSVVAWAVLGPFFKYSDNWQLVINTATTIVTFLMVFLIQRMQNKDSLAIHLKLDELVAAHDGASNHLVSAEELSERDLETLQRRYRKLVRNARREKDPLCAHSVEEHVAEPAPRATAAADAGDAGAHLSIDGHAATPRRRNGADRAEARNAPPDSQRQKDLSS